MLITVFNKNDLTKPVAVIEFRLTDKQVREAGVSHIKVQSERYVKQVYDATYEEYDESIKLVVKTDQDCKQCGKGLIDGLCNNKHCLDGFPKTADLATLMTKHPYNKGELSEDYLNRLKSIWKGAK